MMCASQVFSTGYSLLQSMYSNMKHLWAPWRMKYILEDTQENGCLFCNLVKQHDGPENLILHRGKHAFVVLNRYPYSNGHLMVVPYTHIDTLETLSSEILTELMLFTQQSLVVLRKAYNVDGFNIGSNIGEAAGAGIEEHVHIHIVPRWRGDTNFMATTADTRVVPEMLEETYRLLRNLWTNEESTN
jgi:ATP adenylyltransferase